MGFKFLVCLFLIFLSISNSTSKPESSSTSSNQVQENHTQGSLIHGVGHDGMEAHGKKKPSLHTRDVQVQNEDGDENFMTYMKKSAHGAGGGVSSSIHHSRRNRASSLSAHSSFLFPCIVVLDLILLSII